ncbi:50S ribosomal protein L22 [Flaviflexus equikiangi]|uniref:Large ribosomal subunit protein uL22 n=1 Tax=Flaviflexus equikiangi TaxID=2758573 RepID=A0ABS2TKG0_9ACTO|nr:50S ribosomal protein L22 [Flaviflexus equikiangi]MBM9433769.1 50S ribosomal protein L22 [Flaviflexus equikiangi]
MEAKAQAKYVRITPMKARRVVDHVRGMRAVDAVDVLRYAPQAAAENVRKLLESAMANARQAADKAGERFDIEDLHIVEAYVDEGPTMKRIQPRAQGRANQILKRTSHITIIVGDEVAASKKGRTR